MRLPKAKSLNPLSIKKAVTLHYDELAATESYCGGRNGECLEPFVEQDRVITVLLKALNPRTGVN